VNNLNSVLVEGKISRSGEYSFAGENPAFISFEIESRRFSGVGKRLSIFTVETVGILAEAAYKKAVKGQEVRVVGRLESESNGFVKIIAEHIEFKSSTTAPTKGKMRKEKNNG
jgi:single-stranded DNA-binding protein